MISGAQILMSVLDFKQQLLTGTLNSNTFIPSDKNVKRVQLSRSSKEVHDSKSYYQNPVLINNSPDPGVVKLVDGSGWALITTTNHVTRQMNTSAFPIYFSKGWFVF